MYADSACESDGLLTPMPPKIKRVKDGSLVGTAGIREEGILFCNWLDQGAPAEKRPSFKEFCALQLTPEGLILWDNLCVPMPLTDDCKWWAIGSGRRQAIAAMAAGVGPDRSMQIALTYDGGSRPPVTVLSLRQLEAVADA